MVKLGLQGYIIFLNFALKHRFSVRFNYENIPFLHNKFVNFYSFKKCNILHWRVIVMRLLHTPFRSPPIWYEKYPISLFQLDYVKHQSCVPTAPPPRNSGNFNFFRSAKPCYMYKPHTAGKAVVKITAVFPPLPSFSLTLPTSRT